MAEKYPLAPPAVMPRSDAESASAYHESMQLKKQKRRNRLVFIALFAIFLIIIILVLALVVIRAKAPKVRLARVAAQNISNGNFRLTAQVRVRNTNFARYKFESSIATVKSSESGETIGQFFINDGRVRARSTKRIDVIVDVNPGINSATNNSGVLRLRSEATLRGKVEVIRVFKRKKSAEMRCTMSINLTSNVVQDLNCE